MKAKVYNCTNRYCECKFACKVIEKDDRDLFNKHGIRYCPVCSCKMS